MSLDLILDISLGVVGLTALTTSLLRWKWGPIIGLFSQPLWFAIGYRTQTYSICVLSIAYGVSWCVGIKQMWFKKREGVMLDIECGDCGNNIVKKDDGLHCLVCEKKVKTKSFESERR